MKRPSYFPVQFARFFTLISTCLGCKGSWVQIPPRRPSKSPLKSIQYIISKAFESIADSCRILSDFSPWRFCLFVQNSYKRIPRNSHGLIRNFQALGPNNRAPLPSLSQTNIEKTTTVGGPLTRGRGNGTG